MAKNSIRDYSATNSLNTDIQSIDISEGCSPAGINNAIREVMADLKDVSTGAVALESPSADSLTVTGDLTVDTNTLHVDSTNNRVGIGTSSPTTALDVTGTVTADGLTGDSLLPLAITAASGRALTFNTGSTENMRINSSGNVGIGQPSPQSYINASTKVLHLKQDSANGSGVVMESDSCITELLAGSNASYLYNYTADPMVFGTSNAERLRIDSSGNVLVGTTVAASNSDDGVTIGGYGFLYITRDNDTPMFLNRNTSDGAVAYFRRSGTTVGSISVTTSSTAYNTSSDYRLKTNVTYDWDATSRLKQLKPARFEWIADGDDAVPVDGFLAHEVQDIVPEAITGTKDAMRDEEYEVTPAVEATYDDEGNVLTEAVPAVMGTRSVPDYQGIDQSKLVPLLVKTIQELEARITALEAN